MGNRVGGEERGLSSRRELGAAGEAHLAQAEEQRRAEAAKAVFAAARPAA